jgi:endonuclease G
MPRLYRSAAVAIAVATLLALILLGLAADNATAQDAAAEKLLLEEHAKFGVPTSGAASPEKVFVRKGYIMGFDPTRRIPSWVSFHIKPAYCETPKREGRFKSFRNDPDIANEGSDDEYTNSGFDRGHLAPYGIMGGDRDGDGNVADLDAAQSDEDDELTIKQSNFMSNITPQDKNFNQGGALWFILERWIQDKLIPKATDVWVIAGCIHNGRSTESIGPAKDIHVPPMFFQVVAIQQEGGDAPLVLAFLFPHYRTKGQSIEDFLTTVDTRGRHGVEPFQQIERREAGGA